MKIKLEKTTDVPVGHMKDGDIAVITKWRQTSYEGDVVQRFEDYLISVGKPSSQGWGKLFKSYHTLLHDGSCMVRILPKGTVLEID